VSAFWLLALCAVAMVLAQDVIPGHALYHYGWYNAINAGLAVVAALYLRGRVTRAALLVIFGTAIVVVAGLGSGLMGPDTQTIIGAPGATVRNADVGGSFIFPLAESGASVQLQRGNGTISIGGGRRYSGGFIFWQQPRPVVYVNAADAHGNHLTITQPTNASFLSPVLLMQQSTSIAGMNVNYDTFSVPAASRTVKAVLFSEQQAAQLRADPSISGKPAVLFAVSNMKDQPLSGGIGIVPSGGQKLIAGLNLQAAVQSYPAIVVASAPYFPVLILGLVVFVAGVVMLRIK
jgi:hypothetical protein